MHQDRKIRKSKKQTGRQAGFFTLLFPLNPTHHILVVSGEWRKGEKSYFCMLLSRPFLPLAAAGLSLAGDAEEGGRGGGERGFWKGGRQEVPPQPPLMRPGHGKRHRSAAASTRLLLAQPPDCANFASKLRHLMIGAISTKPCYVSSLCVEFARIIRFANFA